MLRVFEGVVARRLLLNFRLDAEVARSLLPAPLLPRLLAGRAFGGVSLVRIEQLRPRGLKPLLGLALESMAHRLAVSARGEGGSEVPGVYVLKRHTESRLVAALGQPLFSPGHRLARFEVEEDERRMRLSVRTEDGAADVEAELSWASPFRPSACFATLGAAEAFFQECECGFSAGPAERMLEAVQLKPFAARLEPVSVHLVRSRFFEDEKLFPEGAAELDSAFAARSTPHEWVVVREQPEILEEPLLPQPA